MMSEYEFARENWERERLRTMRDALSTKLVGDLPLELLGPALRVLGEMRGSPYGGVCEPRSADFAKLADHLGIKLQPPPKKKR